MENEISLLTAQLNETRNNLEKENQELQTKCSLLENETLPQVSEALSQKESENEEFLKKIRDLEKTVDKMILDKLLLKYP